MEKSGVEILCSGKFLALLRDGRWEYVSRIGARGAAFVLALTPALELILVEQYRVAVQGSCIELPAGIIADSEDRATELGTETAVRELEEETGFIGVGPELLLRGPTSPGLSSEFLELYLVRNVRKVGPGGGAAHEGEDITVHIVPLKMVPGFLQRQAAAGKHIEPRIYAGLWFAERLPMSPQNDESG